MLSMSNSLVCSFPASSVHSWVRSVVCGVRGSRSRWETLTGRHCAPSNMFFLLVLLFPHTSCPVWAFHIRSCSLSQCDCALAFIHLCFFLVCFFHFILFFASLFVFFCLFFCSNELRPRQAQGGTLLAECTSAISMRSGSHGDNAQLMSAVNIHSPGEKCSARSVNYTAARRRHRVQSELTPSVLEKQWDNDCNQRCHRASVSRRSTTKQISITPKRSCSRHH